MHAQMLGFMNLGIEQFITESFGQETWKEVLLKSQIEANWISSCPYADKFTFV